MSPSIHHSPALRIALGLPASTTPHLNRVDGEVMSQPEARLSREIRHACVERGAFAFKIHGGPTMMVGLPDLVMCYRGIFVGMEVKMPQGVVSRIQLRRIDQIEEAGGVGVVVRSVAEAMSVLDDLDAEVEEEELQEVASA